VAKSAPRVHTTRRSRRNLTAAPDRSILSDAAGVRSLGSGGPAELGSGAQQGGRGAPELLPLAPAGTRCLKAKGFTMGNRSIVRWSTMAAAALGLACGGGGGGHSSPGLTAYVTGVTSSDGAISAVHKTGALPAAAAIRMSAKQPAAAAQVAATPKKSRASLAAGGYASAYLPGGTAALGVDDSATRVIVAIVGIAGYWELSGLTPTTGQTILVTFGQSAPTTFTIDLGVGDADHITGYTEVPVSLTQVGTGDVQVNVTWDLDVDVDLHVLDPSGEEIYYGNPSSSSSGDLDLDSNAGCGLDHVRAENITWAAGKAPAGTYKVLVDYYEACTTGTVNYVVTVNVKGHAPQTFAKTFTEANADGGTACFTADGTQCGTLITSFTSP
jgi:hypothetical protein